jgi:WS/DGAT/MGAT family acyltransferase
MERLTAADRVMLWPDARWPQEIGAVAVLDGGALVDPDGHFRIEPVRDRVQSRLHLVPRFRQLLHTPRRGLGGPLWIDATAFDLDQHVRVVPLPAPGDEAALLQAVERLRERRLDRSRPLWQMCLLPGLADNRIGLFVRMHHAIADGIAGIATVGTFLDPVAHPPTAPSPPWTPAPAPGTTELFIDNLRHRARRFGRGTAALAHPKTMSGQLRTAWSALRAPPAPDPETRTSLNRTVGPGRTLAVIRTRLDLVADIAHAHGATVNDVLLAATAGGLRALLHSRREAVDDRVLRIDVPITLRAGGDRTRARGNRIGQMIVPVPLGITDPPALLARIHAETTLRKMQPHPDVGAVLDSRIARRAMLKLLDRDPVNVTTADLPGPAHPVYLAGARVLEIFPVLPLMATVTLAIAGLSYAGQFTITATADSDTYPDLDVLVSGAREELDALAAATPAGAGSGALLAGPGAASSHIAPADLAKYFQVDPPSW